MLFSFFLIAAHRVGTRIALAFGGLPFLNDGLLVIKFFE